MTDRHVTVVLLDKVLKSTTNENKSVYHAERASGEKINPPTEVYYRKGL